MQRRAPVLMAVLLLLASAAPQLHSARSYRAPDDVAAALKSYAARYPRLAKLESIGRSSGGSEIWLLRIAARPEGAPDPDLRPGIFVAANVEGAHLIGTEAALALAERLLSDYGSDKGQTALLERAVVYVAPLLNPDAARKATASPLAEAWTNARPFDTDLDGLADEDGPDDLNKDGLIAQMRVRDPEGKFIPDPKEPRLMRLAEPRKGETGLYALYQEGFDNDGDGAYNEDGPGGVEVNRNFAHDFEYGNPAAGRYPVSEPETAALLGFLTGRGNIGLVLCFGTENTVLNQQQTGQARLGGDKVKVPKMFAGFLGLDPDAEYTIKEIVDILKGMRIGGGMEITEDVVAMFLGLGPAVAIDRLDQPLFDEVQKAYKDALKAAKSDYPEKRAKGVGKGSFAAYAYYQYGVPVFSLDLWGVPEPKTEPAPDALTAEKLKGMSSEEFSALGEERIDAFLKERGAPPNFNAAMLLKMVKSGQVTPAKMAEMMDKMPKKPGSDGEDHPDAYVLKWSDQALGGKGFLPWTPVKHPTLGEVEVGGFLPYLRINPPPAEIEKSVASGVDFFLKLMDRMPRLAVKETKVEPLGRDLFRLTVYLENRGWLPTSTAQGRRAQTAWPITVRLALGAGQQIFSGRPVESLPFLEGSGGTGKLEWTVRGKKGSPLAVSAWSPRLGTVEAKLVLE